MKVLSFIIPSYNSEQYLHKCITSMIDTAVIDKLDIIIVNDGSTDSTADVAKKFSDLYPASIRLISQENKGHGGALNTGCAIASGKYLKVIDADDWVETQNLQKFVLFLEKCSSDVVLSHHYTTNVSNGEIKKWMSYPPSFDKCSSFADIMPHRADYERSLTFHGITYNTEFYRKNAIELSEHIFYEDHEYATIPCCYAKTISIADLFIYNYRIGDVNQSVSDKNQLKRISHVEAILHRFIDEYNSLSLSQDSFGREYFAMKASGLLLSYITTVLFVEPNKKHGRIAADEMMLLFERAIPRVYELSHKQYRIFRMMNTLHISKKTWEKILRSRIYRLLRRKRDFN